MSKSTRILIVEDEAMHVALLKIEIADYGWEVCAVCSSGEEGIEQARNTNPDVILMDIRLAGDMDGIECARQILEFSKAKIVFMTGYDSEEIENQAKALNPFAYYYKPVSFEDLSSKL
jgi:DNA-binding NarL/FixJ family response regulator